ncbi:hypothetical protein YPPY01_1995 [Yersinia pestis PY-01]|nr:hypothetical protein YPPY01_1995 [Yersinia pestis PY-01]EIR33158.1 hypothetical protein YPPY10_2115 [Yersinia pestis PY-10]EIR34965.1 hypothetical protein YPPY12_2223 [Yersinia pestis PY-12]EIR75482.1 hypothetical protein YPPY29_1943 [Yersinia pestis PY-29]EIS44627.1 hypothetical protein YPPY60_2076 [Yersinia pestis PY-60]EIS88122.1 hypothetical protein YPPY76_1983 [Yersinia pestis PY-76]EIS99917.1 hypothetical protein YPPY90_2146 [Yersinia pestis PY-90]KGA54486.1 hypothetical protein DJ5
MELLMDPSIWAGLLTLVVLEIVLGIDHAFGAVVGHFMDGHAYDTAVQRRCV